MKKINFSLLILLSSLILLIPLIYADCTVTLDADSYVVGETVTATMTCSAPQEQSQTYTLNWTNATHYIEVDTGTTPAAKNTPFYATYTIPANYNTLYGSSLNASLYGTNLEGIDNATITSAAASNLIISNISITSNYYIDRYGAVSFKVEDSSGNEIANAQCIIDIVNGDNLPIVSSGTTIPSQGDGRVLFSTYLSEDIFEEDLQYKWDIACTCFNASDVSTFSTAGFCYDSDGSPITEFASAETQYPFTITDIADKMSIQKWQTEYSIPGIYMKNEFGAKTWVQNNPTYVAQEDINFSSYNNTQSANTTQNGQAFITAGELAQLCFIVNNTFDEEKLIFVYDIGFDADNDEAFFYPIDYVTGDKIKGFDKAAMQQEVKHYDDENSTYEKCTEQFIIPFNIYGSNDWDVQAYVKIDGFDQAYRIESDEFVINARSKTNDYITVTNVELDKKAYYTGEPLHVCGNVTNSFGKTIQFTTYYNLRCSSSGDFATDRSLILEYEETRTISAQTSQHQCARMIIPHLEHLRYKTTDCYARVTIETPYVTDAVDNKATTKSDSVNLTDYGMFPIYEHSPDYPIIKLFPDWRRFDDYIDNKERSYYRAKVNISKLEERFIDEDEEIEDDKWDIHAVWSDRMPCSQEVYNYTVLNSSGQKVDNDIENKAITWTDLDGDMHNHCALGIKNVNFSDTQDDYFEVYVYFEDFMERQTEALEGLNQSWWNASLALQGIESKTGTFHLDVNCPASATIGQEMTCAITAQIEDSQQVEKEVDFTCYITDNINTFSSLNFNQMVTRTPVTLNKNFLIPESFNDGSQYILQCHADYYNFGSRRDSFYDTFSATTEVLPGRRGYVWPEEPEEKELSKITGWIVDIIKEFPISPKMKSYIIFIIIISLLVIGFSWIIKKRKKFKKIKKEEKRKKGKISKLNWKDIYKKIFIAILILIIICLIIYLTKSYYPLFQDNLLKDIILVGFITLMIIILFKTLNIRGEIKFGNNGFSNKNKKIKKF